MSRVLHAYVYLSDMSSADTSTLGHFQEKLHCKIENTESHGSTA